MDISTHQKHAKLTRPELGQFNRNEWAIIGTPCGAIKNLAFQLTQELSEIYKVSYVDADHQSADQEEHDGRDTQSAMAFGASMEYTDKITYHRLDFEGKLDSYQYRVLFNDQDLTIVNGNHFTARQQIVVIDPKKEKSLKKKLNRLTQVDLILLQEGVREIYPFLKEHLENWQDIPVYSINDLDSITAFIKSAMQAAIPPLYGLVLAGGKSQRMGQDKGMINYHGKIQREFAADQLSALCDKTFISCRPDQVDEMESDYPTLPDTIAGLGPFGAIVSAFRAYPNHAWLVVACDLPLLDKLTLRELVQARNISKLATAFNSPVNEFPEPLICIWEPRSYSVLLQFLAQGYSCPRKALINSPIELLEVPDRETLRNVNTPEELEEIFSKING